MTETYGDHEKYMSSLYTGIIVFASVLVWGGLMLLAIKKHWKARDKNGGGTFGILLGFALLAGAVAFGVAIWLMNPDGSEKVCEIRDSD
uniref:Uncharacterized protein n=1 Tax=viral metagenome TaxID=1070528 RepID=A0A6C0BQJ8_9ZZZZ